MADPAVVVEAIALGDAHPIEPALVRLVARALPGVPELAGRWYWDARPDAVVVAHADVAGARVVVGVRVAVSRVIDVAGRAYAVVGTGIAVDPAWQRRGVGTALTSSFFAQLVHPHHDAVVAFLATENALPLLGRFGFARLPAPVWSEDRDGNRVLETAPCMVRDLRADPASSFVAACVEHGGCCVGRPW